MYSDEQGCSYKSQLWLKSVAERETWGNPEYADLKQKKKMLFNFFYGYIPG